MSDHEPLGGKPVPNTAVDLPTAEDMALLYQEKYAQAWNALAYAAGVIKGGGRWNATCDEIIGRTLAGDKPRLRDDAAELRAAVRKNLAGIAPFLQALSWNPLMSDEDQRTAEEAARLVSETLAATEGSEP